MADTAALTGNEWRSSMQQHGSSPSHVTLRVGTASGNGLRALVIPSPSEFTSVLLLSHISHSVKVMIAT